MKKLLFVLAAALVPFAMTAQKSNGKLIASNAAVPVKWNLDKSHSSVKFSVQHLVISEVEGNFKVFNGNIESPTSADFNNARISFTVDVNSINTDDDKRDAHLKGDDFFSAEKYPAMKFASTTFKKVKGNVYALEGNLTIRDVTKKVKFAVVYGGSVKDPWGNTKAGFKASGKINRKDFGLKWGSVMETGGAVVGDEVNMVVNVEFAQQKA
jgi:polyisoprenoid-binding protein YceI